MKKLLALVLTAAMLLSFGALFVSAATDADGYSLVEMKMDDVVAAQTNAPKDGVVYLTDGSYIVEYRLDSLALYDTNGTLTGKTYTDGFGGPSTSETTSWSMSYRTATGNGSGIPKGVNGEDLLNVRIGYDRERKAYSVTVTPINNPTVEIFYDVTFKVKFVKVINKVAYQQTVEWAKFDLLNKRYTSKDVYRDATGNWRIDAGDKFPVVDESVFNKTYGGKLIVNYPDYNVIFPTVKNQDIALNLQAKIAKTPTVSLSENVPIMTATFHDIYVKDAVTIEFKVNADSQNYKGTTLYAYELDANGNIIKEKEVKVTVTDSGTIVTEVAAGTRLSAYGAGEKLGTYGIFAEPQEATSSSTTPSASSENPKTGASDVVSVAAVFAVVSLAAAGFVAVGKAGKK